MKKNQEQENKVSANLLTNFYNNIKNLFGMKKNQVSFVKELSLDQLQEALGFSDEIHKKIQEGNGLEVIQEMANRPINQSLDNADEISSLMFKEFHTPEEIGIVYIHRDEPVSIKKDRHNKSLYVYPINNGLNPLNPETFKDPNLVQKEYKGEGLRIMKEQDKDGFTVNTVVGESMYRLRKKGQRSAVIVTYNRKEFSRENENHIKIKKFMDAFEQFLTLCLEGETCLIKFRSHKSFIQDRNWLYARESTIRMRGQYANIEHLKYTARDFYNHKEFAEWKRENKEEASNKEASLAKKQELITKASNVFKEIVSFIKKREPQKLERNRKRGGKPAPASKPTAAPSSNSN